MAWPSDSVRRTPITPQYSTAMGCLLKNSAMYKKSCAEEVSH